MIISKDKKTFKGYKLVLNSNAIPLRKDIKEWIDQNVKFCIVHHQYINILFFSDDECLSFVLAFFDCVQILPITEIEYAPTTAGILNTLETNYKRKKRKKNLNYAFDGI